LLWWLEDPDLLSKEAMKAIRNGKNAAFVSAAVL
jgi:PIN domain nuclease of toxin-antitoxin system